MKKTIITIVAILTVMVATLCMSLTMTACDKKADSYNISVVYADGTAVNGHTDGIGIDNDVDGETAIHIQICAVKPVNDDGLGHCTSPILLGTDGKVSIKSGTGIGQLDESQLKDGYKWHVQIMDGDIPTGWTYNDVYLDGYGNYTITITK